MNIAEVEYRVFVQRVDVARETTWELVDRFAPLSADTDEIVASYATKEEADAALAVLREKYVD